MRAVVIQLLLVCVAFTARADAITVQRLDGRCGENVLEHGGPVPPLVLRARLQRHDVRLLVRDLQFNCGGPPDFHTATSGDHVLTLEPYLPPGHPAASCTCFHELTLLLSHVPPGHWTVRIPVGTHVAPGPSGLVSVPDYASTTVDVS